jgi:hypothetical protein
LLHITRHQNRPGFGVVDGFREPVTCEGAEAPQATIQKRRAPAIRRSTIWVTSCVMCGAIVKMSIKEAATRASIHKAGIKHTHARASINQITERFRYDFPRRCIAGGEYAGRQREASRIADIVKYAPPLQADTVAAGFHADGPEALARQHRAGRHDDQ